MPEDQRLPEDRTCHRSAEGDARQPCQAATRGHGADEAATASPCPRTADAFSAYHPTVNLVFFALVITCSMFFMHPVCLGLSFVCALSYMLYLNGRAALRFNLRFMLPLLVVTALLNPAFNHAGVTALAYLPNGNPLTLESILYGVAAAFMLITVIAWFSCFNTVMTSDKFVYLFGCVIPALSLILAITLRLVPRYRDQIRAIADAQRCIGRDLSSGTLLQRARHGIRILSIMVTWALENAVETADSMRSRGYGLAGRTAFSLYRFTRRDGAVLLFLLGCGGSVIVGAALGGLYFQYFPSLEGVLAGPYAASLTLAYLALCAAPLAIDAWDDSRWRHSQSRS